MGEAVVSQARFTPAQPIDAPAGAGVHAAAEAQRAARRTLRAQIARLESELGASVLDRFERRGEPYGAAYADATPTVARASGTGRARLLDLGELERVRDALAARVREVDLANARLRERQVARRELLEQMLLEPGRHRFTRISCRELGDPGCGVWHVRPRLGLIGMLAGWWQVKLSSGCPLRARRETPALARV